MQWRDCDVERNVLVVERQFHEGEFSTLKGGVTAEMPLVAALRTLLLELKMAAENKSPKAPVFPTVLGGIATPQTAGSVHTGPRAGGAVGRAEGSEVP